MSDRISPLKLMFPPFYWTAATTYDGVQPSSSGSYGGYLGNAAGHDGGWEGGLTIGAGATFSGGVLTNGNIYAKFWNEQEIDLIGLFAQGKTLTPLGINTQRTEPLAAGEAKDADLYARQFVFWTTQPLSSDDRQNLLASFSPTPPYFDGDLHPEQVIQGYSETFVQSLQNVGAKVGFLSGIQRDNLGFMDTIASPKLYCTRLLVVSGTLRNTNDGVPLYIDIPFSCEFMTVVEQEPDELELFTNITRSLQPPTDS